MTKKLLLADDSITIQKVIGIIFATEDYQLMVCDDGNEAFEKALGEYPDLVIADVSMPGKDGFELCQAIKGESRLGHTSVLLLPGTFDHFDEGRAEEVGADGWLSKPFESQALLDKVAQLLEAEPVRLAAAEAPVADAPEVVVDEIVTEEESVVDEVALGLDEVEELAASSDTEEDSPDDIWDAVSFEEDDLQQSGELDPVAEANLEELPADTTDEDSIALVEETPPVGEFTPDTTAEPEFDETVGFSAAEEPMELESTAVEDTALDSEDVEPLELSDEVAEEAADEEPLELEEESPTSAEAAPIAGFAVEEEAVFVAEDSPVDTVLAEDVAVEELPVVEPLSEAMLDDDDEILDLADEDILEDELLEEEPVVEQAADTSDEQVAELAAVEGESEAIEDVAGEEIYVLDEESVPLEEPVQEAEPVAETSFVEQEVTSEVELSAEPEATEDEGFYYDASETADEESSFEPAAEVVAEVAAVAAVDTTSSLEQVEQQLRELSEDELKEVVAKVAGPTIEKLANEMLEQIVWEVVPDLAESMIREEIRKIRQGAE